MQFIFLILIVFLIAMIFKNKKINVKQKLSFVLFGIPVLIFVFLGVLIGILIMFDEKESSFSFDMKKVNNSLQSIIDNKRASEQTNKLFNQ